MARTEYSTDADLVKIRPNILGLGVAEWDDKHKQVFDIINRVLISRWYRNTAYSMGVENWRETPFDPELVDETQLFTLSCYKVLELIYMNLMKDSPEPDGFEREMGIFRKLYNAELKELLGLGINYDWDDSGTIDPDDEKYIPSTRRLRRC